MKKIMFNDKYGLTDAVLSGRKTQTRRIAKVTQEDLDEFRVEYYNATFDALDGADLVTAYLEEKGRQPYIVGEIVAIAQRYKDITEPENEVAHWYYEIGDHLLTIGEMGAGWNNKMFVRADLMPHQIRINKVRVERLQDISNDDCIAEGIMDRVFWEAGYTYNPKNRFGMYMNNRKLSSIFFRTPQDAYKWLIDKIYGKGTWRRNPFVFVYDFKLI